MADMTMQTRGEKMLELRRSRMRASIPFLRGGFRPFFFGGAAWALIALTIWVLSLVGMIAVPSAFDPVAWHRHEMAFGFVGAVIAGFLLTAVPNWTGRLPIAGWPLASLFGLWLAGRIVVLFSAWIGPWPAAFLDSGFFFTLALVAAREVIQTRNRNLPVVGLVVLFGLANLADHAAQVWRIIDPSLPWQAGLAVVIILISLIGGRIVPSFTRNWLARHGVRNGLPQQPGAFDIGVIVLTALALLGWIAAPAGVLPGILLSFAAIGQLIRLARWRGWRTVRDPMVFVLHVAYLWIPVGLGLLAAIHLGAEIVQSAAVHALTAGAMATMILAVMTRATLGHTGRELRSDYATTVIYLLVTAGAVLRVAASLGAMDYHFGVEVAAAAWAGSFLLFLLAYGPILASPRVDGRE